MQSLVQMACDSRLLDSESRQRAVQTIATNVEESLHVKHQVNFFLNILFTQKFLLFKTKKKIYYFFIY